MLPKENIIRKLITSSRCEVCGQHYEMGNIHVLGHEQDTWYLRIRCSACHRECLMAAVIRENRPSFATDLSVSDAKKFENEPTITADDMLDMHDFLKNYNGDIAKLLSSR